VNPGSALDRVSSNRIKQVMPGCEVQYSNQQHIILRSWRELSSNLTTNFFFPHENPHSAGNSLLQFSNGLFSKKIRAIVRA